MTKETDERVAKNARSLEGHEVTQKTKDAVSKAQKNGIMATEMRKGKDKDPKELKRLKDELQKLWSIKIRSIGKCAYCGKEMSKGLNAHHLLSSNRYSKYRYDLNNGISICFYCHIFVSHKESVAFAIWLQKEHPEKYQWCLEHYEDRELKKWTKEELEIMKLTLLKK